MTDSTSNGPQNLTMVCGIGLGSLVSLIGALLDTPAQPQTTDPTSPKPVIDPRTAQMPVQENDFYSLRANVRTSLSMDTQTPRSQTFLSRPADVSPIAPPPSVPKVSSLPLTAPIQVRPPVVSRTIPAPSLVPFTKEHDAFPDYHHSDDFHTVYKDSKPFELSMNESRVVEYYFKSHENGVPEVTQSKALFDLEIETERIKDVFKRNPEAFKALFTIGKRKGSYRLNIS